MKVLCIMLCLVNKLDILIPLSSQHCKATQILVILVRYASISSFSSNTYHYKKKPIVSDSPYSINQLCNVNILSLPWLQWHIFHRREVLSKHSEVFYLKHKPTLSLKPHNQIALGSLFYYMVRINEK